jgi:hypothetical protein
MMPKNVSGRKPPRTDLVYDATTSREFVERCSAAARALIEKKRLVALENR